MEELSQLKKRFESNRDSLSQDYNFNEWRRIYRNTNENLSGYMQDIEGKKVLSVSASGDFKINAINLGASTVDTFDINRYSPLYQELRLKAIEYLDIDTALKFLFEMDKETYRQFNMTLSRVTQEVFDYLFENYSVETIYNKLFDYGRVIRSNNTYYDEESIKRIKERLSSVDSIHYECNVYSLPYMIRKIYDVIYLSNISQYEDPDKYLTFLRTLQSCLSEDGQIFFGYSYSTTTDDLEHNLTAINPEYGKVDKSRYEDLFQNMDVKVITGASGSIGDMDAVVTLKKTKNGI